jgi:hypothetical protein
MIRANDLVIPGISGSAGQTIALFAGISSMLSALWELGVWWEEEREEDAQDGAAERRLPVNPSLVHQLFLRPIPKMW